MRVVLLVVLFVAGCDAPAPPVPENRPNIFQPAPAPSGPTGTIVGRVSWVGPIPSADPIGALRPVPGGKAELISRPAPNVPSIDPGSRAVANVIAFLRGPIPSARPWDHPPVSLEIADDRPMIRQGDGPPRAVGLVRAGDEITIVSREDRFHSVRARGAAFWTFTLPDRDRPVVRRLDRPGIVELSSAAGYFWMNGYLLVSEHPYCVVTDAAGRFTMPQSPPGDYELAIWLPSWEVIRRERDPESTAVTRMFFAPARQWVRPIRVKAGKTSDVTVTIPE